MARPNLPDSYPHKPQQRSNAQSSDVAPNPSSDLRRSGSAAFPPFKANFAAPPHQAKAAAVSARWRGRGERPPAGILRRRHRLRPAAAKVGKGGELVAAPGKIGDGGRAWISSPEPNWGWSGGARLLKKPEIGARSGCFFFFKPQARPSKSLRKARLRSSTNAADVVEPLACWLAEACLFSKWQQAEQG